VVFARWFAWEVGLSVGSPRYLPARAFVPGGFGWGLVVESRNLATPPHAGIYRASNRAEPSALLAHFAANRPARTALGILFRPISIALAADHGGLRLFYVGDTQPHRDTLGP